VSTLNPAAHATTAHDHDAAHAHGHHDIGFVKKYIFSTDHKIIGIQFLITTLLMLLVGYLAPFPKNGEHAAHAPPGSEPTP